MSRIFCIILKYHCKDLFACYIRDNEWEPAMLNRIFSTDSAKAAKAEAYGYLNGIHYLAPHDLSGTNLCPKASAGCLALCLGWHSGQAAMVTHGNAYNNVRQSRVDKARRFMSDRAGYMRDVVHAIELLIVKANKLDVELCIRMNGSSDIAWEGIRYNGLTLFETFPDVIFVDYTKLATRFNRKLPVNYHLTFSRSETNEKDCLALLARGVNVAVVADHVRPKRWHGYRTIDGDKHDLRMLDPRGCVVWLSPKGRKAKRDKSGFVLRKDAKSS
jgi:hypothetical protein